MVTATRQGFPRPALILPLSLLLLFIAFTPVMAVETVETVGFSDAVARALQHDASVGAAGFDLEIAKRDVEIARASNLPSLTFEEKFVRSSAPAEVFGLKMNRQKLTADDFADPVARFNNPAPLSDFITSLSVEQPIFAPRAILGYRMAKREAGAREMDTARTKEESVYRVVSAYLGVLTAKEFVGVTGKALDAARQHYELAGKIERAGLGLASDELRARVSVAEAEAASVTAKNRLELARKALSLSMGGSGGVSIDASGDLPPMPPAGTLEERIAQARRARTDLGAIAIRAKNAESNVDLERTGYLPTVGLRAGYQLDGDNPRNPDDRSWNVGVGFRWNLFDGMRNVASVARARGESGKAKEQLRGAVDRASFQVSQAYLAVIDSESRVVIAREAVAAAEEGTRLLRARYENQLAKMIDVLDAQSALDGARAGQVRAANDLRQARADLEFATGTLLPWATQGRDAEPAGGNETMKRCAMAVAFALALAAPLALAACGGKDQKDEVPVARQPVADVAMVAVAAEQRETFADLVGTVRARTTAAVAPQVMGRLTGRAGFGRIGGGRGRSWRRSTTRRSARSSPRRKGRSRKPRRRARRSTGPSPRRRPGRSSRRRRSNGTGSCSRGGWSRSRSSTRSRCGAPWR